MWKLENVKKNLTIILSIIIILIVNGCIEENSQFNNSNDFKLKNEEKIIGIWINDSYNSKYSFYKNNSLKLEFIGLEETIYGNYILFNETLKIIFNGLENYPSNFSYNFTDNDTLILTYDKTNESILYYRVH